MPKRGVILIGEPVGHYLIYSSCFFKKLPSPGNIDKKETNGTVSADDEVINVNDPRGFYHVGHGSEYKFTAECMADYIDSHTGLRMEKFSDRIVHLLSCLTAQELGPALVSHGTSAYLGYYYPFYFGARAKPGSPPPCNPPDNYYDFYSMTDCDVEVERKMLRQATLGEAVSFSQSRFRYYIDKYTKGEWKNRAVAYYALLSLQIDKGSQRLYGDSSARLGTITPAPEVTTRPASSISGNSANLNLILNSTGGVPCKVWFEWNGKETPKRDKSTTGAFTTRITELTPETTYKFRACASNPGGVVKGDELEFTTPKAGWSPLHWAIDTVETTRPDVPVEQVEKFISEMAVNIKEAAPELKFPGKPPPPPPEL